MGTIRRLIDRLIMLILVLQGIFLVLIIGVAVFYRYVIGAALSWPGEVAGIVFVWYTLLGIVILEGADSHIGFDFIEKHTPAIVGKAVRALSQAIVILYGVIMTVYGWKYLQLFPDETSPAAGINLNWLKSAVPITGVLIVVYVALKMADVLRAHARGGGKGNA
jgi:TRAP-type C4-dicarboxylate transport system permease small subunit